jgi:hypothetical protein
MAKKPLTLNEIYGILNATLDSCYELQYIGNLDKKDYEVIREKISEACSVVYIANRWPGMLGSDYNQGDNQSEQ